LRILGAIFEAGFNFILRIAQPIFEALLRSISNTIRVIHGIIKLVLDLINGDWGKAWHDVLDIFSAIWDQILNMIKLAVIIVADMVRAVVEAVIGIASAVFDAGKAIAQGVWDGIVWVWDLLVGWVKDAVNGFIDLFKSIFGISSPSSVMKDIGIDIITGLLNGIVQMAVAVFTWFGNLAGTILGYFGSAINWLWQKGSDIIGGMANGIVAAAQAVWNWFGNLAGTIGGYFAGAVGWLFTQGHQIISGMFDGIGMAADAVWTWFKGIGSTILGFFTGAATWLFDIGKNIIQGLIDGIGSMADKVASTVKDIAVNIAKAPLKALGIGSPSKVFDYYGQMTMLGFEKGLISGFSGIPDTVAGLFAQLSPTDIFNSDMAAAGAAAATQMGGGASNRTITFNGDLSFPNITNADDAEGFIKNLEALAESRS
jgi:phage-related protein